MDRFGAEAGSVSLFNRARSRYRARPRLADCFPPDTIKGLKIDNEHEHEDEHDWGSICELFRLAGSLDWD
jgi:hypothetical protein